MSNGFDADQKWVNMMNTYKHEKRDGSTAMNTWKKCYLENLNLQSQLHQKSKVNVQGFNPVRDRFNSPAKDRKYFSHKTRTFASKGRIKRPLGIQFI
jgi:hypothetical protein